MSSSPYMNNINNSSSSTSASGGVGHQHHNNNNHNSSSQEYGAAAEMLLDGGAPGENNHHHDQFLEDGPMMLGAAAGALDDDNVDDSEEDTEEASETEMGSSSNHRNADEPIEIKEQMYQDKLASLKKQLDELRSGTHPEYVRRVKKLEHQYSERIRLNEIYREYLINCVERDYILEKNAAVKEYEEKKIDLKENLMTDFEDRRKMIETERATMELTGDSVDVKPTITRKLRRRPNEPLPVPEKRRKPTTGQLVLLLDEKEVENDLKLISRGKAAQVMRNHQQQQQQANGGSGSGSSNSHSAIPAPVAAATNNGTSSSVPLANSSVAAAPSTTPIPSPTIVNNNSYQINSSNSSAGSTSSSAPAPSSTVTSSELTPIPPPSAAPSPVVATSQPVPAPAQPTQQQPQSAATTPVQTPATQTPPPSQNAQQQPPPQVETRIEDGKLLYERRWFHRGQPVYVEGRDIQRFSANISAIGSEAIWVKKTADGQKVRIFTAQLSRGKVSIKRRAN